MARFTSSLCIPLLFVGFILAHYIEHRSQRQATNDLLLPIANGSMYVPSSSIVNGTNAPSVDTSSLKSAESIAFTPDIAPSDPNWAFLPAMNDSATSSLTAGPTRPHLWCEAKAPGQLTVARCLDAIKNIPDDTKWFTVGRRHTDYHDVVVPWRVLSGKLPPQYRYGNCCLTCTDYWLEEIADGLCAIDMTLKNEPHISDIISMPMIKRAATRILERCVATEGKGGFITHQGDNEKLGIRISEYNPSNVFCEGAPSAPPVDSCRKVLDTFPFTEILGVKAFGPAGTPDVQEKIPAAFLGAEGARLSDQRCAIIVDSRPAGSVDYGQWRDLWYAAQAVYWMCVKQGRPGQKTGLGITGKLFVASSKSNLRRARLRRILTVSAFSIAFTSAGFLIASAPAIASILSLVSAPTDAESLTLYKAPDEQAAKINDYINSHPLALSLRTNPAWVESRPHLRLVDENRKHSLTGGTLLGHGKIPVPPLVFLEEGKNLVSILYVGTDLCGHVGIVHGGLLATLCDEGLARCGFSALPNKIGVTANLTINYRNPAPAGSFLVLKAETIKAEGRKVWVKGRIELLSETEEAGKVLVEAEALFIEPRYAKSLPKIFRDTAK